MFHNEKFTKFFTIGSSGKCST